MAAPSPSVQHHFSGDGHFLTRTLERRTEVRKALTALQQAFSQIEGQPTHMTAEIKLVTKDKENIYTVSVSDAGFDVSALPPAGGNSVRSAAGIDSPLSTGQGGGRLTPARRSADEHDMAGVRPFKKSRPSVGDGQLQHDEARDRTRSSADEALAFMKDWHVEWKQQGGWLFDTLNRAGSTSQQNMASFENKLNATQDILGQSMNAANAATVAEFDNIKNLIPWLEQCRKTSDDKVQAREEKWRSSSATFHDQSRRDREAAEKRLEEKLDAQRELLVKIARAGGIDLDDPDDSREGSLGAQLTAELNLEASRGARGHVRRAHKMTDQDTDNDEDGSGG